MCKNTLINKQVTPRTEASKIQKCNSKRKGQNAGNYPQQNVDFGDLHQTGGDEGPSCNEKLMGKLDEQQIIATKKGKKKVIPVLYHREALCFDSSCISFCVSCFGSLDLL